MAPPTIRRITARPMNIHKIVVKLPPPNNWATTPPSSPPPEPSTSPPPPVPSSGRSPEVWAEVAVGVSVAGIAVAVATFVEVGVTGVLVGMDFGFLF